MLPPEEVAAAEVGAAVTSSSVAVVGLWRSLPDLRDWSSIRPMAAQLVRAGMSRSAGATVVKVAPSDPAPRVAGPRAAQAPRQAPRVTMPDPRPAETVLQPQVFAERTATGMPVDMALDRVVEDAWERVEGGMDVADSMTAAEDDLLRFIDQVCADTARDVERADVILTPRSGWARVVRVPCCKRCAVLAGRVYQWSQGFERHPRCRCTHRKVLRGDDWPDDIPSASDLVSGGGVRDLTRAEARALDDGADLAQVVNARRRAASGMTTTEGMSRRGWARAVAREYARQSAGQEPRHRLTVTAIYRLSSDRDEAVRLLARNGYVTDRSPADVADLAR